MARVTVDTAALTRWCDDARDTRAHLTLTLDEVDVAVTGMAAAWHGEAAQGFDLHIRAWRGATRRQLATLGELTALVDTALSNYLGATEAGLRTWTARSGTTTTGPATVSPASAGSPTPARRIDAETDDIAATVVTLRHAGEALGKAWQQLSDGLAGTAAMAGDDELAALLGRHHDGMAAAAWQGWRAATIMLAAIAGGLTETGNAILDAEHRSTAAATGPPPSIAAHPVPVPAPAPPPPAAGPRAAGVPGPLARYWPPADPGLLRAAATAWSSAAPALDAQSGTAIGAMSALVVANPDPTLTMAREFTDRALSLDPSTGLCGVLGQHCLQIARACEELADVTERTRYAIRDAVVALLGSDEWYQPVAVVLDAVLTRGLAGIVARGGDVMLLAGTLDALRLEHERAVRTVLAMLAPAAADRLSRIATSLAPPSPFSTQGCAVTAPAGPAEPERRLLVAEVLAAGHKIDPAQALQIVRAPDGRIVWLERGDGRSGLSHLLRAERLAQFGDRGVAPEEVPAIAIRAVTEGTRLGPVRDGGVAYEVPLGDRRVDVVVVEGSNGYLVTAYPLDSRRSIRATGSEQEGPPR